METIRKGEYLALVCAGNMLPYALPAWNKLNQDGKRITLVSVSDWSDLHADDLNMLAQHDQVVTLEDHNVKSGLGVTIAAAMFERGLKTKSTRMGVSGYASSGTTDDLYRLLGIDADGIARKVGEILQEARVLR
jgi:transketolase